MMRCQGFAPRHDGLIRCNSAENTLKKDKHVTARSVKNRRCVA